MKFLAYLKINNIPNLSISFRQLVIKIKVNSTLINNDYGLNAHCKWSLYDDTFDLKNFAGILFNVTSNKVFNVFQKEDQDYAKNEWLS